MPKAPNSLKCAEAVPSAGSAAGSAVAAAALNSCYKAITNTQQTVQSAQLLRKFFDVRLSTGLLLPVLTQSSCQGNRKCSAQQIARSAELLLGARRRQGQSCVQLLPSTYGLRQTLSSIYGLHMSQTQSTDLECHLARIGWTLQLPVGASASVAVTVQIEKTIIQTIPPELPRLPSESSDDGP